MRSRSSQRAQVEELDRVAQQSSSEELHLANGTITMEVTVGEIVPLELE